MGKIQTEIRLSREMTLLDAAMIGVGAMIGAWIFVLTGIAAGVAGPALLIAFATLLIVLGLLALLAGYAVMRERGGKGTDRPRADREGPSK